MVPGKNGTVFSEKSKFNFHMLMILDPKLGCIGFEKSTVFTVLYRKAQVMKFDFAIKYVKVNPVSSFDQIMIGRRLRWYIPSFVEIGLLEKIFEGFNHKLYGCGGHFGHVTSIIVINFHFHVPKA